MCRKKYESIHKAPALGNNCEFAHNAPTRGKKYEFVHNVPACGNKYDSTAHLGSNYVLIFKYQEFVNNATVCDTNKNSQIEHQRAAKITNMWQKM